MLTIIYIETDLSEKLISYSSSSGKVEMCSAYKLAAISIFLNVFHNVYHFQKKEFYSGSYYLVDEYFIEENLYDSTGELISSGDIVDFSKMDFNF